eukprot:CAMPEP_0194672552 /NCGR_PEP_ID=MMETSP0295-20121207/6522_1 /TAXON_ID=39354 /ORGANISM="Heterosigma akashiwo, Strain CCMP2393" /LENGTH=273 /DNA_ID=CAMNT_0039556301 /DNA_START=323 /DNA_END=1140 /DNA_ORIENTATION=-
MRRGGSARPGCHPDTKKSKQKIITWLRGAHLTSPLRTTGASDIQKGPGTRGGGEARGAGLVSLLLLLAALLAALVGGRVAALGRRRGREPRGLFPGGGGGGGGEEEEEEGGFSAAEYEAMLGELRRETRRAEKAARAEARAKGKAEAAARRAEEEAERLRRLRQQDRRTIEDLKDILKSRSLNSHRSPPGVHEVEVKARRGPGGLLGHLLARDGGAASVVPLNEAKAGGTPATDTEEGHTEDTGTGGGGAARPGAGAAAPPAPDRGTTATASA